MSDTKKFWRESVGVLPRSNAARARKGSPPPKRPSRQMPARDPFPDDTQPQNVTAGSPTGGPPITGDPALPAHAQLAPIEQALGTLPVGSVDFPEQVAVLLWPEPRAADLQRLAEIAGNRHLTPVGAAKEAVLRAVLIRQTYEKLIRSRARASIDTALATAQSGQWTRLLPMVGETCATLESAEPGPASAVLAAARALLPDPEDVAAECRLAVDLADLRDALSAGSHPTAMSLPWGEPLSDVHVLLNNLSTNALRQGDPVAVEAYLAVGIARQWLAEPTDRSDAELARRILERVQERLQAWINTKMTAHSRDFEWSARMSAWRRLLLETHSQIDEAMTRPASAVSPASPERDGSSTEQPMDSDDAIVEHLRQTRNETEGETPRALPRWLRWFTMGSVLLTATISGSSLLLPPLPSEPSPVLAKDFAEITPLGDSRAAGEMMIATADPQWEQLDEQERRIVAGRLASKAESLGLRAGLLMAHDGTPLLTWSPGTEPLLRANPLTRRGPQSVAALWVSP